MILFQYLMILYMSSAVKKISGYRTRTYDPTDMSRLLYHLS